MGHLCTAFSMSKSLKLVVILLGHFKFTIQLLLFYLLPPLFYPRRFRKMIQVYGRNQNHNYDRVDQENYEDYRPSPSMVPVPFTGNAVSKLVKKKLRVIEFGQIVKKSRVEEGEEDAAVCVICLACIGEKEEIREPANCSHVYHRECLDRWVDGGHVTCPMCRLKLLPSQE